MSTNYTLRNGAATISPTCILVKKEHKNTNPIYIDRIVAKMYNGTGMSGTSPAHEYTIFLGL